jgi:phosphoserine aminotransferase
MISFYPGPSRVHDEIPDYVKDACKAGILSINHRSGEFMEMSEKTIALLKSKLEIPNEYTVFFTASATECWEIIAQSVIEKNSFHIYNGAFGRKWFEYTRKLRTGASGHSFAIDELVNVKKLRISRDATVICLTQNETSNGTQVSNEIIGQIRERYPDQLIAVDATSSMAGILLDFAVADIWFASVQKCFGLPAGLGLMICSAEAMARVKKIGEKKHYNSLTFMAEMMVKWQTPFTPNVLNIYLLNCVMNASKPIREVHLKIAERYRMWLDFFDHKTSVQHLIRNEAARSLTVIPVAAKEALVTAIKSRAKKNGFLLGEGYGDLKASTFRIANFPAIKKKEIYALMEFLDDYE